MRAALLFLALALPSSAAEDPLECPPGTERQGTDDPLNPLRCAPKPGSALKSVTGARGFPTGPRCPKGTREVPAEGLRKFRCAPIKGEPRPEDAGEPVLRSRAPRFDSASKPPRRWRVAGELSFEYPGEFRLRDEWREDVPAVHLVLEQGGPGKPVSIVVTRAESSQSSWLELDAALAREIEWQGAKDAGRVTAGGRAARAAEVPGSARTVYLPLSKDSYYTFVYSAPAELFERHRGSFERVLKTLKLEKP